MRGRQRHSGYGRRPPQTGQHRPEHFRETGRNRPEHFRETTPPPPPRKKRNVPLVALRRNERTRNRMAGLSEHSTRRCLLQPNSTEQHKARQFLRGNFALHYFFSVTNHPFRGSYL